MGWKNWRIVFGYDRRTVGGKRYKWVDEGTGIYIGGSAYPITPKKADMLVFTVPTPIKTTPGIPGIGPGLRRVQGGVGQGVVVHTKKVMHKGIRPRYFSKSLKDMLSQRTRPGGIRSTTDAAVKRAFRKL